MAAKKSKSAKARQPKKKTARSGGKTPKRRTRATAQGKGRGQTPGLAPLLKRLRAELGPDHSPAWIIDAAAASLMPLNGPGSAVFDLKPDTDDTVALDTTMPALTKLRKLANKPSKTNTKRKTKSALLFWTPTGTRSLDCQITRHEVKGRTLFLVKEAQEKSSDKPVVKKSAEPPAPKPEPLRDDAAILREIARRIRAGTKTQPVIDDVPGELPEPTPKPNGNDSVASDNSEMDGQLRAKLAHELRTPISAIVAASEIIKDERLGSLDNFHYRDYARDIHQSARHALELIEQGLKSVAEQQTVPLDPPRSDRADLNHIVRSAVATVKHLAQAQKLSLAFVPAERDAWLQLDPTAVTQVVLNLLTNAVKFTEAGGTVTAQVVSRVGEDVFVEVRDTGCGMSQSEITRHLARTNSDAPKPRDGGGFGIGLALSHQLAEANGATLEFDSKPGHGTSARLMFPLRRLVAV